MHRDHKTVKVICPAHLVKRARELWPETSVVIEVDDTLGPSEWKLVTALGQVAATVNKEPEG